MMVLADASKKHQHVQRRRRRRRSDREEEEEEEGEKDDRGQHLRVGSKYRTTNYENREDEEEEKRTGTSLQMIIRMRQCCSLEVTHLFCLVDRSIYVRVSWPNHDQIN